MLLVWTLSSQIWDEKGDSENFLILTERGSEKEKVMMSFTFMQVSLQIIVDDEEETQTELHLFAESP